MIKKICVIAYIFLLSGFSYATVYFVDNGKPDDSGSGLSWPDAKKTISAAVDVSSSGDTIIVRYGEYPLSQSILINSDRMITSDNGLNDGWDNAIYDSSACILTGDTTRIFTITSNNVSNSTYIRGFKITHGHARYDSIEANYGGGICISDSADPVIEHCWITENRASNSGNSYGGGIAILGTETDPIIQYCAIDSNLATSGHHGYGGGIYIDGANAPQIHHNKIYYNDASIAGTALGGGIYSDGSDVEIFNNDIQYNVGADYGASSGGSGGGIYAFGGNIQILSNTINNNVAGKVHGGSGGGIYITTNDGGYIHENDISYNIASTFMEGKGGGLYLGGDNLVTSNNTISYNIACTNASTSGDFSWRRGSGGGACVDGIFQNNTVTHNKASLHGIGNGGGIYFATGNSITHNIISHNIASENDDGYGGGAYSYNAGNSLLANNVFYSNANQANTTGLGHGSGFYYWYGTYNYLMKNNIFSNHNLAGSDSIAVYSDVAVFISNNCFYENGIDYNANITSTNEVLANPQFDDPADGSFEILYNSPCIDAGADTLVYDEAENHDMGWVVDIGVHEYMENRVLRVISGAGEYYFGGQVRAKVNVTVPGSLTAIDITVHANEFHPQAHACVQRWFEITPTGAGSTFDLTLSYKDAELNGQDEYELNLWRWDDSDWYGPGISSDSNTAENWLTVTDQTEFSDWVISEAENVIALSIDEEHQGVHCYQLSQNYPNPFNPKTIISYSVEANGYSPLQHVDLSIFNMLGQKVATLINEKQSAGSYKVQWNATGFASGVYFYKIQAGDFVQVKKMLLVK